MGTESAENTRERVPRSCLAGTILAAVVGLALMTHSACTSSATYDEVTYLRIAAKWWLTGNQISITRMGSPLTFWKLQQAPTLAALDALGRDDRILEPEEMQARLLPVARIGSIVDLAGGLGNHDVLGTPVVWPAHDAMRRLGGSR